jgi:hypothetical protein
MRRLTWAERLEASWMARHRWSTWVAAVTMYCVVVVARRLQAVGRLGDSLEDRVWPWRMR